MKKDDLAHQHCDKNPHTPECKAINHGHYEVTKFAKWIMVLNCLVVTTMLVRLLLFLRIFKKMMLMVFLVWKVTQDLMILLIFWIIWVIFFALQSVVLGTDIHEVEKFHGASIPLAYFF